MSDRYFIDTNIFVYCFDDREPGKKALALTLIADALKSSQGITSWQVIQEFLNVSTRKFANPLRTEDAKTYLQRVLYPLCHVFPDLSVYWRALDIVDNTGYSLYDSLILASALQGKCGILYSEDLRNGHQVDGLIIRNPFLQG